MSDLNDRWPDDDVDQIVIAGLRGRAEYSAAPLRANESRKLERGFENGVFRLIGRRHANARDGRRDRDGDDR
jgi:hypothetical protein